MPITTGAEAERELDVARRIDQARAIIDALLRRTQLRSGFQPEELDDLRSAVVLRLVQRLSADAEPVVDCDAFVAAAVFHAIDDLLRKRYPERAALKNRLRYALTTDARLALRRGTIAALAGWADDAPLTDAGAVSTAETAAILAGPRTADALHALLVRLGGPVLLDELVQQAEPLWRGARESVAPGAAEALVDPAPQPSARAETRQSLARLWGEILLLPHAQRVALLLGLREPGGVSAVPMLVFSGTATLDQIAAAIGLTRAELEAIWNDLPLDDAAICRRLGVTRQQVAGLRKSARERLARRREKERF